MADTYPGRDISEDQIAHQFAGDIGHLQRVHLKERRIRKHDDGAGSRCLDSLPSTVKASVKVRKSIGEGSVLSVVEK